MVSSVNSATSVFSMPDKPFMNSASSTFFGTLFQENTSQFATLETAQKIAGVLGGKVVDLSSQWTGGSQTTQYGIQLTDDGPILNAGLIAQRCLSCGTEAGLSAALQEAKSVMGQSISYSEAMSSVLMAEQNYMASTGQTSSAQQTASTAAAASPINNVATPATTTPAPLFSGYGSSATSDSVEAAVTDTNSTSRPAATESVPSSSSLTSAASAAATSDAATAAAASLPDHGTIIPAKSDTAKLASSARDFEALMIGQMLKSVREASNGGWLGSESEGSTGSAVEMAETQVAQSLAASGGLGLGNMVLKSLERRAEVITPSFDLPRS